MADIARHLISKIIDDNDITTALSAGVKEDWFEEDDYRRVFKWITEYFTRYGEVPTEVALKTEFPIFKLSEALDSYEYYTDKMREQRHRSILLDAVVDAHELITDGDPKKAHERISRGLLKLGRETNILTDSNAVGREVIVDRFRGYQENRHNPGELTGIATGFSGLDLLTGGFHSQQFILFGGLMKHGKSFMLMKSALAAQAQSRKVLFLSFEMSTFEQLVRYDSMISGIDSGKLLRGVLNDDEMRLLRKGMARAKNLEPFIISADVSATTTLSALSGKIEEHQPDIIFIDGVYLMENEVGADPLSTQAYTAISRGVKRLAQRTKLPVVATTQVLPGKIGKGGEVLMTSMGWTSAWGQDADLILGVERVPKTNTIKVRVAGGRNVSPMEMSINCRWDESSFEEVDMVPDDDDDD